MLCKEFLLDAGRQGTEEQYKTIQEIYNNDKTLTRIDIYNIFLTVCNNSEWLLIRIGENGYQIADQDIGKVLKRFPSWDQAARLRKIILKAMSIWTEETENHYQNAENQEKKHLEFMQNFYKKGGQK